MKLNFEITEKELRQLVLNDLQEKLGSIQLDEKDIQIQVKSKQNYRSEWEEAAFKAVVTKTL